MSEQIHCEPKEKHTRDEEERREEEAELQRQSDELDKRLQEERHHHEDIDASTDEVLDDIDNVLRLFDDLPREVSIGGISRVFKAS